MERGQSECLIPMVQSVLDDAKKSFSDLGMIAVTQGPGAFAGLRIGLITAKTLGQVLSVPVAGVSTFDAIAHSANENKEKKMLSIVLETKRHDFYFKFRDELPQCLTAEQIMKKINTQNCHIIGNANQRLQSEANFPPSSSFETIEKISMEKLAELAHTIYQHTPEAINSDPIYLRGAEIGTPKRKARKISIKA